MEEGQVLESVKAEKSLVDDIFYWKLVKKINVRPAYGGDRPYRPSPLSAAEFSSYFV